MEREVGSLQRDALETIIDSKKRKEINELKENEKKKPRDIENEWVWVA